jgi:acyl-CoA synthetase (AMP-forming)/AMP-acid ligase II
MDMIGKLSDIESMEAGQPDPFSGLSNTYNLISESAARNPDAPALSFFPRIEDFRSPVTWSYRDFLQDITKAANLFRRLGIQRKDVLAYILPNLPETHFTLWGGEAAGIVFAANPLLEGKQLGKLLDSVGARWLVTVRPEADPENWLRIEEALQIASRIEGLILVNPNQHLPQSEQTHGANCPSLLLGRKVVDFHEAVQAESGAHLNFELPLQSDVASYLCTGGTTGLPKIARHTHWNETCNVTQLISVLADFCFAPGHAVLTALPLFHVNAQFGSGLAVFASGAHAVLAPPAGYRTPGLLPRFWEIVEHYRLSSFSGVPAIFASLMQVPIAGADISSLRAALCGGAPLPVELAKRVQAETGVRILEGYGLTEGTCVASINPPNGKLCVGSIGFRMPWAQMRMAILDTQGSFVRWAHTDEPGAICISGPNVMPGYLDPVHDEGAFFDAPSEDGKICRWLSTGDLGRQDTEGYFWLTGRKKELIIRGGHNIDPKMIEEALASHPAVALCAAVGRPDVAVGELPVAYVQLRADAQVSEEALLLHAQENIGERAAWPKAICLLTQLPMTAVGKIAKPQLSMLEVEAAVRATATQLNITLSHLQVDQDPRLGIVAYWRASGANSNSFAVALGGYSFKSIELGL